ncbi:ankyrin repeat and fibronectin type-III domain-containing protein 1-like isoform X1 [Synchiropus splendidus]|uniref:ankyrin repeat and fibronectin type-III domain-containing protein 1-like isoform X1 n=1 Tax=Synchiropus splendidus TaxID=270530 RepID=UPI00237ED557|nr:ankyrin repeat and fibronectin type-III domain-containing protein 1-like isoform X1 [Synchiropus splendidus]XP_053708884.1 ankyrin repeat and fibronectin type-III domain-containing protein 1-like isoform X1 [Synchiropus splendidus]
MSSTNNNDLPLAPLESSAVMNISMRNPPQRRRSMGPVSPKRIYRNLSVRLRGGEPSAAEEADTPRHVGKAEAYKTLWEAVENEDTLAVQSLLSRDKSNGTGGGGSMWERGERKERDWERERERGVNRVSEQGLVPLDVAALTHNSPLMHVLTRAGAKHNPVLCQPGEWAVKLGALVALAGQRVEEWKAELVKKTGAGPQGQADVHRQIRLWSLRLQLYCRMKENFQNTELPGPPSHVSVLVTSTSSLFVVIKEPEGSNMGLITRYKVEWSSTESFKNVLGSAEVTETKNPSYSIRGLTTGVQYSVRVRAYNVKGWGPPQDSTPGSIAPSSWRQCVGVKSQFRNPQGLVKKLLEDAKEPHYRAYCIVSSKPQSPSKRLSMSRGIKQLFQSATKFVRLLQRGVYLATVFYYKESLLLTGEDQLPLVEIQCCTTSFTHDFLWFAKLSCAWQQVPWLQQALSTAHSSPSSLLQNRHNILRAVSQLQSSLGTMDLGQVYYEPLKDRQGNILLVTLKELSGPPSPPDPPFHWLPLARLEKNRSRTPLLPEPTAMDMLYEKLKDKLSFHRHSLQWAQSGLYVGILKLCSSVEQIRVLVPQRLPNLLCHTRVRHNAHVSREEWEWLQSHNYTAASEPAADLLSSEDESPEISSLPEFIRSLRAAVTLLLTKLNIPLYRAYQYGVYTRELLQFGENISLLLLLPPSEDFSSSYWPLVGTKEPGLTLPLQIFELVHFWTYERDFLSEYCQAWVRLELDTHLAQQALREALDTKEVQEARERLSHVTDMAHRLDMVWRDARWVMDCLQCVRSKQWVGAVPLGLVMGGDPPPRPDGEEEEESLTARLTWPHRMLSQRTATECLMSTTPPNVVTAEVSTPAGMMVVPEESALDLVEGVAKGGYPVDITAQSTLDLTSIGQTELGCSGSLIESALESVAVAQLEADYTAMVIQESYGENPDFPPSITEVIQPMEMAELVDILPTLTRIEEETPTDPSTPSVIDMLESLGLGLGESQAFFHLESSNVPNGAGSLSDPLLDSRNANKLCENPSRHDPDTCEQNGSMSGGNVPSWNSTPEEKEHPKIPNRVGFPVRNHVEWDRTSSS